MIHPLIFNLGLFAIVGAVSAYAVRVRTDLLNARASVPLRKHLIDIGTHLVEDASLSNDARKIGAYFVREACASRKNTLPNTDKRYRSLDEIRIRWINEMGERVGHEVFKGMSTLALIRCFEQPVVGRALRRLGIANVPRFVEELPFSITPQRSQETAPDQFERLACGVPKVEDATIEVDRHLSMA